MEYRDDHKHKTKVINLAVARSVNNLQGTKYFVNSGHLSKIIWSAATIGSRALTAFGLFFLLARASDPETFGQAAYYYSVALMLGLFADYGYNLKLISDLNNSSEDSEVIRSSLILKLTNSVILIGLLLIFVQENVVLFIFVAGQILNQIGSTLFPYLRFKGEFKSESIFVVINNGITFGFFLLSFVAYDATDLTLGISILIGKLALVIIAMYKLPMNVPEKKSIRIKNEYISGFSFFMHSVLGVAYVNLDTIILESYTSLYDVGLYQAAIKIMLASVLFCDVLVNYFYPAMFKALKDDDIKIRAKTFSQVKSLFISSGVFFSLSFIAITYYLSGMLFGSEYKYQIDFILLLGMIIILRYFGGFWGIILTIGKAQKIRVYGGAAALISLTGSAIVLIPAFGILGAGLSNLIAHLVINIIYYFWGARCIKNL